MYQSNPEKVNEHLSIELIQCLMQKQLIKNR